MKTEQSNKDNEVEAFLQNEREYFKPILDRQELATEQMRAAWRKENVHERRKRISLEVYEKLGKEIRYGPFRGLKLDSEANWSHSDLGAMALGIYEKEVLDWIEENYFDLFPDNEKRVFVDIGAADGYYAIGMVHSGLAEQSICFEIDPDSRSKLNDNAERNNVSSSIDVWGDAAVYINEALATHNAETAFVICDIEGGEFDLLTETVINKLRKCTILIEIHHWVDGFQEKYERLIRAASQYFNIDTLKPSSRPIHKFRELDDLTDDNRQLLGSEGRPNRMRFLLLTPRLSKPS